jgi:hypothetical protein
MPLWSEFLSLLSELQLETLVASSSHVAPVNVLPSSPSPSSSVPSSIPLPPSPPLPLPTPLPSTSASASSDPTSATSNPPNPPQYVSIEETKTETLDLDSDFTLVTAKSKSVITPKIEVIETKNNKKSKGIGKKKNSGNKTVEDNKGNIALPPKPLVSVVNNVNVNIPKPNISPIYPAYAPTSGLTPDFYLRELFQSFQKKMSSLRNNSSSSGSGSNSSGTSGNSGSGSGSGSGGIRFQSDIRPSEGSDRDRNSNSNVRFDSSNPVQFSADVAASGVRTIVVGTYCTESNPCCLSIIMLRSQ